MTNLIPPQAKKQLVRLYRIRLVSAWAIFWSLTLLVSASLLLPTYLLITGISNAYSESVASAAERTEVYDEMIAVLNQTNQEAKNIIKKSQEPQLSNLLQDIWSVDGQGVGINSVQIQRHEGKINPIRISGEAEDRQALASVRDRIEALPYVTDVDLPIENLAQNQDIIFSITISVNTTEL